MKAWKNMVMAAVVGVYLISPALAYYDEYDDYEDAHPLRLVAYPVHAAGYAIAWLVTRPLHALVSQPELEPIFGHRPSEWNFAEGLPPTAAATTSAPPPPSPVAIRPEDLDAVRRAAEDARAAAEEAKRAAEAAAQAAEKANRAFERSLRK
jgi:hypothetical protein